MKHQQQVFEALFHEMDLISKIKNRLCECVYAWWPKATLCDKEKKINQRQIFTYSNMCGKTSSA